MLANLMPLNLILLMAMVEYLKLYDLSIDFLKLNIRYLVLVGILQKYFQINLPIFRTKFAVLPTN